jgi:hypothetical protein
VPADVVLADAQVGRDASHVGFGDEPSAIVHARASRAMSSAPPAVNPTARFTALLLGKTLAYGSALPTIRPSDRTRPTSWPNAMTSRDLADAGSPVPGLIRRHQRLPPGALFTSCLLGGRGRADAVPRQSQTARRLIPH